MAEKDMFRLRIVSKSRPVGDGSGDFEVNEYYTDACVRHSDGKVEIIYREDPDGYGNTDTHITFLVDMLENVTIERNGDINNKLEFVPHTKKTVSYNTGVFPIELTVATLDVKNEFLDGGALFISYYLRLGGDTYNYIEISVTAL